MKNCNSCAFHYADRSGTVCNAFHAIASVDQAEQCQDYALANKKVSDRRDPSVNHLPEVGWLDHHRLERTYPDQPNELLPFAIGISFDPESRCYRYRSLAQDFGWSYHAVTQYEVEREFIESTDTFGNRIPIAATANLLLSASIEIRDPFLDLRVFDGHYELDSNREYREYRSMKPFILIIRRLPVALTISRMPIAPTASPDTAPVHP